MPQFLYRLQPARPAMLREGPTAAEAEAVGQHFEYLSRLTEAGQVLVAGRTLEAGEQTFGLVIFEAETRAAAELLMAADPAVSREVMRAELFPFSVALWSERGPQPDDDPS